MPPKLPLPPARVLSNSKNHSGQITWKVSDFIFAAQHLVETQLVFDWLEGEVSNYTRAPSGHAYFVLKDQSAQIRCIFFRHRAQHAPVLLQDGLAVVLRGTATIYPERGEFQINVDSIRLAGNGALHEAYQRLKNKLTTMGWFDPKNKQTIPRIPRNIGIITSPQAAALLDVLATLKRRLASVPIILYPCSVQGQNASQEIAQAIQIANRRKEVDVIILCRGGGSIEDLWPFNEENVAAAIFESAIPIISGVGHEEDETIADFVADARASTPTAAASLAVPEQSTLSYELRTFSSHLTYLMERGIQQEQQHADLLAARLQNPLQRVSRQKERFQQLRQRLPIAIQQRQRMQQNSLATWPQRLCQGIRTTMNNATQNLNIKKSDPLNHFNRLLQRNQQKTELYRQSLAQLNPQKVLERGYAIALTEESKPILSAKQLQVKDSVFIQFAQGQSIMCVENLTTTEEHSKKI